MYLFYCSTEIISGQNTRKHRTYDPDYPIVQDVLEFKLHLVLVRPKDVERGLI